jgi:Dolichyl-phosphate-mannose-protein mannosyltransferase
VANRMDRRLLLLGFVAALAVLVTTRHGVGIDADSVAYVDLASHLRAGNGFALSPGLTTMADPHALRPTAHFPPLYPALLAAGEATGLGAWTVTRWLGIVLAAVNAMLVGVVIRDAGASWGRALVAVLLMVTAVDWLRVHSWALTEPLFLAGVVVTLGALARQIRVPSPRWLLAAGAAAGIAALTRYTGLALLATGALALAIWTPRPTARRLRDAAVFLGMGSLPLVAWHVRGLLVGAPGRPLGMHPITPAQLRTGLDTISAWLLPETIPAGVRVFVAAVALAALGLLWRRLTVTQAGQALTRVVGLFVLCYLALLLATITFVYTNVPLDARLLVPLLVSAILVGWRLPDSAAPGTPARRGLLAACWALVILAGVRAGAWVAAAEVEDLGYASRAWRQSAIVEAVRALPGDVLIVSNAPDAIYVLTGRRAEFVRIGRQTSLTFRPRR